MSDRVRIGFVGVGTMGQSAHLRNYASSPDCEVVAIAEPRPQLARRVARKFDVPKIYENADDMLGNEKVDGLVVSQPFDHHGQVVLPLYQYGLPILTEKPLAASVTVGERMVEALRTGGSWHMVGYHKRSDPATEYAKAAIDRLRGSGELGRLRYVRMLMPAGDFIAGGFFDLISTGEPVPKTDPDPRPDDMDEATFAAYTAFVNYYIHQVNLMRYLLGESYSVAYADPSGVLLVVQSANGIAGAIEMSPYSTTIDWQESALVAFERGWIKLALPAPVALNRAGHVTIFRDPGDGSTPETVIPQHAWDHAMRNQAANYIAAIRGERKPPCEAGEALEDLRVARDYIRLWKEN